MVGLHTKRPGVYSEYSVSSLYTRPKTNKNIAVAAFFPEGTLGEVKTIASYSDALTLFGAGNSLLLAMCNILLQSGINKLYFLPVHDENEGYLHAFAVFEAMEDIGAVLCDSQKEAVLIALAASVEKSSSALRERFALCGADTPAVASALAQRINCERLVLTCPSVEVASLNVAHAVLGACGTAGIILPTDDPAASFNGEVLPVVTGIPVPLSEAEIETLLSTGVTPLEVASGKVECIKAITTRTKTDGNPDISFTSVNTILIIDDVITTIRNSLKPRLKGLKNNLQTRESIVSQVTVELARKVDLSIIDDFLPPRVYPHPNDPSICVVELSFTVAHVINQIIISANIKV